jgi:hypothetical protein
MKNILAKTSSCCDSKEYMTDLFSSHKENKHLTICLSKNCDNYLGLTNLKESKITKLIKILFLLIIGLVPYTTSTHAYVGSFANFKVVPLTIENFVLEIKFNDIICKDEVVAQAKLESNNFNSFLLKKTNNMFGMRYPFSRQTTAIGVYIPKEDIIVKGTQKELKKYIGKNVYAVYEDWKSAVKDYKMWQDKSFNVKERYLKHLNNVYAEDSLYISKIKNITNNI